MQQASDFGTGFGPLGTDSAGLGDVGRFRFDVHGPPVEIECDVPALRREIRRLLGAFTVPDLPRGAVTVGIVRPYDPEEVARYLSPAATRVPPAGPEGELLEVYEDGERFWLVDDRWGLAEINLLRGTWRSWILPEPRLDPVRCAELAVLWPMAQLLRGKGVHLLPAASVVRDGWAALLLCPFPIEPELTELVQAGFRLIGQRWTAVREEEGRLALLHMPGRVERLSVPGLEFAWDRRGRTPRSGDGLRREPTNGVRQEADAAADSPGWVDLTAEQRGGWQSHAFCDAVVVTESSRRPRPQSRELAAADAAALLRQTWPIAELHPSRRPGQLSGRFARLCRCAEIQLSREPRDLLGLLRAISLNAPPEVADAAGTATGGLAA